MFFTPYYNNPKIKLNQIILF